MAVVFQKVATAIDKPEQASVKLAVSSRIVSQEKRVA